MSKHQSTWETITYQLFMPPMVWVLKRELLWIPVFGWGVAMLNPIAINRSLGKKSLNQLLETGKQRLDMGIHIMIFPEGTRTLPGAKGKYRPGGALLATKTGRRIVPIAHNAGDYWPKHQLHKKAGEIQMVIGEPITTEGKSASDVLKEVESWIEGEMKRISNQY